MHNPAATPEPPGDVTVLESRLVGWQKEKHDWKHRLRRRETTHDAYDEWKRAIEPDVRACADLISRLQRQEPRT